MHDSTVTQIIATIGPASSAPETLAAMIDAGMNVARLNLAWGDRAENVLFTERIRAAAKAKGVQIPIIYDLAGPRVQEGTEHHRGEGPVLTEKDVEDIAFGLSTGVEYFALSYIGSRDDIERVQKHIADGGGTAKIIAKIERQAALDHLEDILSATDAIMIARGDLGIEVPLERIPFIEKELIAASNRAGKPVIVATEMMSSMVEAQRPTRAEVTDVAYAVLESADAVMLSNETAVGKHPVAVIAMMQRIVTEAEKHGTARTRKLL